MTEATTSFAGIRAMVGRNLEVYKKTWKVNALPPLAEPFLYLIAMGYGLGALIDQINGIPYVQFIAPAIVAITIMQTAFMETTYSAYVRMIFQKTWDAVMATPLSPTDILWGEVLWAALRATINATLMCFVVAGFGLLSYPTAFLIPIFAFAIAMMFGGIGLYVSSKVRVIDHFSYSFFLFITPQFLFSGTFFPLEQLPRVAQWIAMALPLTHAVQLVRGAALGSWGPIAPWSLLYVAVFAFVLPALAVRGMKRRIVH